MYPEIQVQSAEFSVIHNLRRPCKVKDDSYVHAKYKLTDAFTSNTTVTASTVENS
jgi:hypothetical protein